MCPTIRSAICLFKRENCADYRDEETVEVPADVKTAGELRAWLAAKDSEHNEAFATVKRIRAAVNGTMAGDDAAVAEGDEVAFFPPVTGG